MEIKTLTVGVVGTCCYILSAGEDTCAVIDPGDEAERILRAAEGRRVEGILLTHGHFDHIGAVRALMDAYPSARLFIHPADAPMLSDGALNAGRGLLGREVTAPPATDLVHEGDAFTLAGIPFTVLHTPGHTPGSVCYQAGEDLFTGDTLFHHGWGRTDLPGGNDGDMMRSLRRLMPLAKNTRIHPGHED